jgi:hypothetical protein
MAKRLNKRTVSETTKVSKTSKEVPEPDTFTEKGPVNVAEKTDSLLGRCTTCKQLPSNSESDHLCYDCHMSAKGYEYNGETNLYMKRKK